MLQVFKERKGIDLPNPFPTLTYAEAMYCQIFLCFWLLKKVSTFFAGSSFAPFCSAVEGGLVKAITIAGGSSKISATKLKKGVVYQQANKSGAKLFTCTM